MIIDARELPDGFVVTCDVCIIGAGAAGITLAHELLQSGQKIALMESGGLKLERSTQDLYKGEVVDPARHGRLDMYRQRRFGGTTRVWGGRCAPFDDVDFEVRSHVPHSGWPINKNNLNPYYVRAHMYCDLGAYAYTAHGALPHRPAGFIPGFESPVVRTDRLWRFSLPTDFAQAFGNDLRKSVNVTVYLHANCLKICTQQNGTVVSHVELASSPNKGFRAKARRYVLAAGGLEVTRLLLNSDDIHKNGIGNTRDLLGRFYLSHITGDLGEVSFTPKGGQVIWDYEKSSDGVYCRRSIAIAEDKQRSDQLLNFRATLGHLPAADPRHRNGILSSMYLAKKYITHRIPPEYSRSLSAMEPLRHTALHLRNIGTDLRHVIGFSSRWTRERLLSRRKLPSIVFENKTNTYTLHFDGEQSPNPSSRVTLNGRRDALGMRTMSVDWRFNDLDVSSVIASCQLISNALHCSGAGRMLFRPELMSDSIRTNCSVGSHHLGTTRMAASPCQGVVNENCRVHEIENLYISSSSVFPTSGVANPTLTIVALSIRLADRFRQMD
jgi:choline dehydrogenase-like flavoprotein